MPFSIVSGVHLPLRLALLFHSHPSRWRSLTLAGRVIIVAWAHWDGGGGDGGWKLIVGFLAGDGGVGG